jgi:hypothetical protein
MGRRTGCLLAFAAAIASGEALADERTACTSAYVAAQTRRSEHRLLAARDELRTCTRQECSSLMHGQMIKDCASWLAQVEATIPSVVLSAKDSAGADLTDVRVSMDGAPIATKLDGRAIDIDAGSHVFRFDAPDQTSVTVTSLVLEGAKNQLIRATLGSAPTGASRPAASIPAAETSAPAATPAPSSSPPGSERAMPPSPASETRTRPNQPLVISGLASFGLGYLLALVGGIVGIASQGSNASNNGGCFGSAGLALIPLVGPLLTLSSYPGHDIVSYSAPDPTTMAPAIQVSDCKGGQSTFSDVVIADEILQLGGAALLGTGLLIRSPVESADRRGPGIRLLVGAPRAPFGATLQVGGF